MRQSPMRYLPIAVLALTLQALAPLLALAPLAAAPFDPLVHAALCSDLARTGADNRSSHRDGAASACCVLCAPLAGGVAVLDPPATAASAWLRRQFRQVVWQQSAWRLPIRPLDLNASPRAPPPVA